MTKATTKMNEQVQDFKSSAFGPAALVIGAITLIGFVSNGLVALFQ